MALSRNQIMNMVQMQTQSVLDSKQKEQQAAADLKAAMEKVQAERLADQPILDSLGKWGGGLIEVMRNSSKNFDDQMALFGKEQGPRQLDLMGVLFGRPEYRLSGFQAPGGPKVDYMGIVDEYKKRGAWNPLPSLQLMKEFNTKYGLGLTPEQIAKGADEFGAYHRKKFGVNFIPSSNDLAIAMSSLSAGAGALDNYGTSEGMAKMWAENSPQLGRWDQEAIKRQNDLAASFNSAIDGRSKDVAKYYDAYMDVLDKRDKAENKAFTTQALSLVGSAFVPGLGQALSGSLGAIGGNAAAGALVGGGTAALTGGDVGKGILSGGLSGGLKGANFGGQVASSLGKEGLGFSANALKALGTGINSGLGAAGGSLIYGKSLGDALKAGLMGGAASGVGSYAGSTVGGLAKDAGLGNFLSKGLGTLAGGTASGLVKGQTLGNALTGGALGAGAGMVGDLAGGMFGKDAGGFAQDMTAAGLKNLMMQKQQQERIKQMAQGRPVVDRNAQMMAAFQKMTPQQRAALVARVRKG